MAQLVAQDTGKIAIRRPMLSCWHSRDGPTRDDGAMSRERYDMAMLSGIGQASFWAIRYRHHTLEVPEQQGLCLAASVCIHDTSTCRLTCLKAESTHIQHSVRKRVASQTVGTASVIILCCLLVPGGLGEGASGLPTK
jgi:hypothetical protein